MSHGDPELQTQIGDGAVSHVAATKGSAHMPPVYGIRTSQDLEALMSLAYPGVPDEVIKASPYPFYRGKVRDCFFSDAFGFIVHSDRLSAFDANIGLVPFKGQILTDITTFWFDAISGKIPHHFIKRWDNRTIQVKKATPIKLEIIVRGYLAGSMLKSYEEKQTEFCGVSLPKGLKPYQLLPEPLITPTTKAEVYQHDLPITKDEAITLGILTAKEWDTINDMSLKLFHLGQQIFLERGWLLVDTKYEFGRLDNGDIIVIDEIHTPDSSRLWVEATYHLRMQNGMTPQMFDKEVIRRYLAEHGFRGDGPLPHIPYEQLVHLAKIYLSVAEDLRGEPLKHFGSKDILELLLSQ